MPPRPSIGKPVSGLVALELLSKSPAAAPVKTCWVHLVAQADTPLAEVLQAFEDIGFRPATAFAPPPCRRDGVLCREYDLVRPGSGLLGDWTAAEADAAMQDLAAVFARFGQPAAAPRRLTLQDLL